MKKNILILFVLTAVSNFTAHSQDTLEVKKFVIAMGYGYANAINNDESVNKPDLKASYDKPRKLSAITNPNAIFEDFKSDLAKINISSETSFDKAFIKFPERFLNGSIKDRIFKITVDEILNEKGENVVEPLSSLEISPKNGSMSIFNDDIQFSFDLLKKDDKKIYKAKGNVSLELTTDVKKAELDGKIGSTATLDGVIYKIVKNTKNIFVLQIENENETHELEYLNLKGERFSSFSSVSFAKDDAIFQYFLKLNKKISEKELEKYSSMFSMKQMSMDAIAKKNSPTYKIISLGDAPTKIVIYGAKKTEKRSFPFEVKAEGVKLYEAPIAFSTLKIKDKILPDEYDTFKEGDNILEITGLQFGSEKILSSDESNENKFKSLILTLPEEILKVKNLEKIKFTIAQKADFKQIVGILSKFESLKSLTINSAFLEGFESSELNYLTEIPAEILTLTNLEELIINGSYINNIPVGISNLKKLKNLELSDNILQSIPEAIFGLKNLETLSLNNNYIGTLSEKVCMMPALTRLDLNENRLDALPKCISQKEGLTAVVSNNYLGAFAKINKLNAEKIEGLDSQSEKVLLKDAPNYELKTTNAALIIKK